MQIPAEVVPRETNEVGQATTPPLQSEAVGRGSPSRNILESDAIKAAAEPGALHITRQSAPLVPAALLRTSYPIYTEVVAIPVVKEPDSDVGAPLEFATEKVFPTTAVTGAAVCERSP